MHNITRLPERGAQAPPSSTFWFAIRQISTGAFLPSVASYGFTRQEPSFTHPPRLFKDKSNATQALQWWLKGEAYEHSRFIEDDMGGTRDVEIRVVPRRDRNPNDFEVVIVRLEVKTLEQEALDRL